MHVTDKILLIFILSLFLYFIYYKTNNYQKYIEQIFLHII